MINEDLNINALTSQDLYTADYNHIYSGWISRNTFYSCPENWWVAGLSNRNNNNLICIKNAFYFPTDC